MKKRIFIIGTVMMLAGAITACGEKTPTNQDKGAISSNTNEDEVTDDKDINSENDGTSDADAEEIKAFAEKIQKAVADKDMDALAELCSYPMNISISEENVTEIADKDTFMKIEPEKVFTEGFIKEIADTDIDNLEEYGVGILLGNENSIAFNKIDDEFKITSIIIE